jgi:transposase
MGPSSTDCRRKGGEAYRAGRGSQRQMARMLGVSLSFVQALWQRYQRPGRVEPKPHGGGNPGKLLPHVVVVAQGHAQQPDASLAERCERVVALTQVQGSRRAMTRALRRLELTREKRRSVLRSKRRWQGSKRAPATGGVSKGLRRKNGSLGMRPAVLLIWLGSLPGLRGASAPLPPRLASGGRR